MAEFTWSVSRLLLYLRCPYAYFLKHKERAQTPKPWYLVFGGAIHKAIQICHKGNRRQHFVPTPERPLFFKSARTFGGFWSAFWQREVLAAETQTGIEWGSQTVRSLAGLGWTMLAGGGKENRKGYYQCILSPPFPIQVLEVELRLRLKLLGFPFEGVIDQIWKTEKGAAIVDITSGRSTEVKFLQMTAYDLMFRQWCQQNPEAQKRFGNGASQHYVWNLREEVLVPIRTQGTNELLRGLEYASAGAQDGDWHQCQQDHICRYCEYRQICNKIPGKSFPVSGKAESKIMLPSQAKRPQDKQLYLPKTPKGGWVRGNQVKGKKA